MGDYSYYVVDNEKVIPNLNEMHKVAYYVFNKQADTQIIDARPAARFNAEVDEPRPGLRKGHIPGAKNVPFMDVIDSDT